MTDHTDLIKRLREGDELDHGRGIYALTCEAADALEANHCRDCCCARAWEALGITEYDGKSIPEHILELRAEIERLREALSWMDNADPQLVQAAKDKHGISDD